MEGALAPMATGSDGTAGSSGKGAKEEEPADLKIILCGDSAVGKSKLVERFLLDDYSKHTSSTYAITKYVQTIKVDGIGQVEVDLWDTAGQERFQSLHPGFYHNAHAAILVFDVTRKATYKNLVFGIKN